ncbi:MAG: serine hydrolase domain-containing protein [Bacteroidota bacterium]
MASSFRLLHTTILMIVALSGTLSAQVNLPDTRQGNIVQDFIAAFNSGGDTAMRQFFLDHVSKEGLADRPADVRVERIRMIRNDMKSLTLLQVLDTSATAMAVLAKSGRGEEMTLTFNFDTTLQHKFVSLGIEMGEREPIGGPPLSKKEFLKSVEDHINAAVREGKFSGAVLIARGNSVLLKKAYGAADKRFNVPNRTDTKFNLGSINKFFTRIAIAQLAQAGKLSFDKPIITYLPDYPNRSVAEKVTINQLITMTSGMGDFFGEKFANTPKDKIRTLNDYLQLFVNDSLLFEPGTQRRYSNAGYIVLGLIVERLSGQDYYSYVRDHIFTPAGMNNSDWFPSDAVTPNIATGYVHPEGDEQTWISNIHALPGRGSSAGGGYSTLDDLYRFIHALLGGKFLNARYSEWMLTNTHPQSDPPLPLKHGGIGIAGGTAGVNAAVELDAESGDVVIVLANYDRPSAEAVSKTIRGLMKRVRQEK